MMLFSLDAVRYLPFVHYFGAAVTWRNRSANSSTASWSAVTLFGKKHDVFFRFESKPQVLFPYRRGKNTLASEDFLGHMTFTAPVQTTWDAKELYMECEAANPSIHPPRRQDEPYRRLLMAIRRRCWRTKVSMEARRFSKGRAAASG